MKLDSVQCSKDLGVKYNVTFKVLDAATGELVSEHIGHNQATNSMLTGIAHYLKGDGILNQATHMLSKHIPRYISLGTMGLFSQDEEVIAETGDGAPVWLGEGEGLAGVVGDFDCLGSFICHNADVVFVHQILIRTAAIGAAVEF